MSSSYHCTMFISYNHQSFPIISFRFWELDFATKKNRDAKLFHHIFIKIFDFCSLKEKLSKNLIVHGAKLYLAIKHYINCVPLHDHCINNGDFQSFNNRFSFNYNYVTIAYHKFRRSTWIWAWWLYLARVQYILQPFPTRMLCRRHGQSVDETNDLTKNQTFSFVVDNGHLRPRDVWGIPVINQPPCHHHPPQSANPVYLKRGIPSLCLCIYPAMIVCEKRFHHLKTDINVRVLCCIVLWSGGVYELGKWDSWKQIPGSWSNNNETNISHW